MKKIDNMVVQVTYNVRLKNATVSDSVYETLKYLKSSGPFSMFPCYGIKEDDAIEWIRDNVNELDSYDTEVRIIGLND